MRVGIITISDRSSRGEREDLSGPALVKRISTAGHPVVSIKLRPFLLNGVIRAILI